MDNSQILSYSAQPPALSSQSPPIRNVDALKPRHYRKPQANSNNKNSSGADRDECGTDSRNGAGPATGAAYASEANPTSSFDSPFPAQERDKSRTRRRVPVLLRRNRSGSLTVGVRRSHSSAVTGEKREKEVGFVSGGGNGSAADIYGSSSTHLNPDDVFASNSNSTGAGGVRVHGHKRSFSELPPDHYRYNQPSQQPQQGSSYFSNGMGWYAGAGGGGGGGGGARPMVFPGGNFSSNSGNPSGAVSGNATNNNNSSNTLYSIYPQRMHSPDMYADPNNGLPARGQPALRYHSSHAVGGSRRLPSAHHYLNGGGIYANSSSSPNNSTSAVLPNYSAASPRVMAPAEGNQRENRAATSSSLGTANISSSCSPTALSSHVTSGTGGGGAGGGVGNARWIRVKIYLDSDGAEHGKPTRTVLAFIPCEISFANFEHRIATRCRNSPFAGGGGGGAGGEGNVSPGRSGMRIFYLHSSFLTTAASSTASSSSEGAPSRPNSSRGGGIRLTLSEVEANCYCVEPNEFPQFLRLFTSRYPNDKCEMAVFVTWAPSTPNHPNSAGKRGEVEYYFQDWAAQPSAESQLHRSGRYSRLPSNTTPAPQTQGVATKRQIPSITPVLMSASEGKFAGGGGAGAHHLHATGGNGSSNANNNNVLQRTSTSSSSGIPSRRQHQPLPERHRGGGTTTTTTNTATGFLTAQDKATTNRSGARASFATVHAAEDDDDVNYSDPCDDEDEDQVNTSPVRQGTPHAVRGRPRQVHLLGEVDGPTMEEGLSTMEILRKSHSRPRLPSRPAVAHNNNNTGAMTNPPTPTPAPADADGGAAGASRGRDRTKEASKGKSSSHSSQRHRRHRSSEPWQQTLEALSRDVVPWVNVGIIGKGAFGTVYEGIIDADASSAVVSPQSLASLVQQQQQQRRGAAEAEATDDAALTGGMKKPLHVAVKVLDLNLNSFSFYGNGTNGMDASAGSVDSSATSTFRGGGGSSSNHNNADDDDGGHDGFDAVNDPVLSHVKKLIREINLMRRHRHTNIVSYIHCQIREKEDERVRGNPYNYFSMEGNNEAMILGGNLGGGRRGIGGAGGGAGIPGGGRPRFLQVEILMELCTGGTLTDQVKRAKNGKLPVKLARRYIHDVLSGLAFLHSRGVIHRDIKPDNVLISKDGVAKLADFGCSRRIADATTATFSASPSVMSTLTTAHSVGPATGPGSVSGGGGNADFEHLDSVLSRWDSIGTINNVAHTMVGTPLFMAPEVVQADMDQACGSGTSPHRSSGHQSSEGPNSTWSNGLSSPAKTDGASGSSGGGYAAPADIWAVGCLTLQLFGRTPWPLTSNTTPFQIMLRIAQADRNSLPPGVPNGAPATLRFFLAKCLQRDPRRRASARELLRMEWMTCAEKDLEEMS